MGVTAPHYSVSVVKGTSYYAVKEKLENQRNEEEEKEQSQN
jgi:hypothetical protein